MIIQNLLKSFSQGFQLGPLSLSLETGETVALVGHNGAGKTTLFELMTGNLFATRGTITFQDQLFNPSSSHLKKHMGYLPQTLNFPHWASPRDLLYYLACLQEIPSPLDAVKIQLEYWDCLDFQHKPIGACSYGMQKRVGLALANLSQPPFMILDEPFSGLDLAHLRALIQLIQDRQRVKATTLMSTHIMPYAAQYAHRCLLIQRGQLQELTSWPMLSYDERLKLIDKSL